MLEITSFGVLAGYTVRFNWLLSLVRSTVILTPPFGLRKTTMGWHHGMDLSPTGSMISFLVISSNSVFTSSRNAYGIGRAAWIAKGVAPSHSSIFIGSPSMGWRRSSELKTSLYSIMIFSFISSKLSNGVQLLATNFGAFGFWEIFIYDFQGF